MQSFLFILEQILQVLLFEFGQLRDSLFFPDDLLLGDLGEGLNFFQQILLFLFDGGQFKIDFFILSSGLFGLLFNLHILVGEVLLEFDDPVFALPDLNVFL